MEIAIAVIIDIALIAVFIVIVGIYGKKGFLKSLIGLASNIVALILAVIFSAKLGTYIDKTFVREPMIQWFVNTLSPTASTENASVDDMDFDSLLESAPKFFTDALDFLNVDLETVSEKYYKFAEGFGSDRAKSEIVGYVVGPVSDVVSRLIAFVVLYIAFLILAKIVEWLASLIGKIPGLRVLDKFAGFIVGLITATLVSFVFVSVINITFSFILRNVPVESKQEIVSNTYVFRTLDSVNPLNSIFDKFKEN